MKKVSIVIPTRNRGHLLRYALRSALRQTYAPLEIIVCDNCSTDNTRDVVDSLRSGNVVYVRSDEPLSMPDNWELALRHASGEYVTYLTDDSYLLQSAIKMVMEQANASNAKVVAWMRCAYVAFDWMEAGRRNVVYIPETTSKTYLLNSSESLRSLWANDKLAHVRIPRLFYSLCHASVIQQVISVQGRFFLPPCPDYTSAVSVMLNVPEYLFIDYPLCIDGVTPASIGATSLVNLGKSAQEFIREFQRGADDVGYLGIPTLASTILRGMQTVHALYATEPPPFDRRIWLRATADDLARVEANGGEIRQYWQTLTDHLAGQPLGIRLSVAKQRASSMLRWRIARKVWSSRLLGNLETLVRKYVRGVSSMVRGDRAGFQDIEGCAQFLEQSRPSPRNALIPPMASDAMILPLSQS